MHLRDPVDYIQNMVCSVGFGVSVREDSQQKKCGNLVFSGVSEPNMSLAFFKETKEELSNALKYHLNTL